MHFPRAEPRGAGRAVGAARSCGASHSRMGEGGVSRASPSRGRWWHKASCVCTGLQAAGGVHVETEAQKKSRGKRVCAARSRGSCPGGTFMGAALWHLPWRPSGPQPQPPASGNVCRGGTPARRLLPRPAWASFTSGVDLCNTQVGFSFF